MTTANRPWCRLLVGSMAAFALLIGPAICLAAEGGEAGAAEPSLFSGTVVNSIAALVIFAVLLVVLGKFAWGPVVKLLEEREQKIAASISDAERGRDEAMGLLAQYKQQLAQIQAEAQKLMQQTQAEAEKVKQQILDQARGEADQARQRAVEQIEASKDEALAAIFSQAANLATLAAGQILQRELRPEDHQRLVEQTVSELGQKQSRN